MRIGNILKMAMAIVGAQSIEYRKFVSRETNSFGVVSPSYTEWQTANGFHEPGIISSFGGKNIELRDYKELGLDWSKRYITVWIPDVGLSNTSDQLSCDEIFCEGRVFSVIQVENWAERNGWIRAYCVENKGKTR